MCIGRSYVECDKEIDVKDGYVCENIFRWHSHNLSLIGALNRDIGENNFKRFADLVVGT
jgi:hypothetical protein